MRRLKAHRKIGRTTEHRIAMLRNLATSLINADQEHIITTVNKAKELRPFVEKAITLAAKAHSLNGDDAAKHETLLRRQAARFFIAGNPDVSLVRTGQSLKKGGPTEKIQNTAGAKAVRRLFGELGERYKDRAGGYTRIIKLGRRVGDSAEMAVIELIDNPNEPTSINKTRKRATRPLRELSDSKIISLTKQRMSTSDQILLEELLEKDKREGLSDSQSEQLARLIEEYDDCLLRKSEALSVAVERGLINSVPRKSTRTFGGASENPI